MKWSEVQNLYPNQFVKFKIVEYHEDNKYKEIDSIIKEKTKELNNNSKYQEYLSKLKKFNNTLLASSSLLEDYIDSKVSI